MDVSFESLRQRMVDFQIEARGIKDRKVLEAFRKVPRHEFVAEHLKGEAYQDCPLPIGNGQTISQPYMVASMTQAAAISPGDRCLEIGTGSGYQTAILAELCRQVHTVERVPAISARSQELLEKLGYANICFRIGDGTLGWPEESPFNIILVTAGAPSLPAPLSEQLAEEGRIVIPLEEGYSQILCVFTKHQGELVERRGERCTFVPLIGRHGWKK